MAAITAGVGGPLYADVDNSPNSIPMIHNEAYERTTVGTSRSGKLVVNSEQPKELPDSNKKTPWITAVVCAFLVLLVIFSSAMTSWAVQTAVRSQTDSAGNIKCMAISQYYNQVSTDTYN